MDVIPVEVSALTITNTVTVQHLNQYLRQYLPTGTFSFRSLCFADGDVTRLQMVTANGGKQFNVRISEKTGGDVNLNIGIDQTDTLCS